MREEFGRKLCLLMRHLITSAYYVRLSHPENTTVRILSSIHSSDSEPWAYFRNNPWHKSARQARLVWLWRSTHFEPISADTW